MYQMHRAFAVANVEQKAGPLCPFPPYNFHILCFIPLALTYSIDRLRLLGSTVHTRSLPCIVGRPCTSVHYLRVPLYP